MLVATAVRNWAGFGVKKSQQTDLDYLYRRLIEKKAEGNVLLQKAPETKEELADAVARGRRRAWKRKRRREARKMIERSADRN